jgi:hypothetical protein
VEPAFAQRFYTETFLSFDGVGADAAGLALQNIGATQVSVTLQLLSGANLRTGDTLALTASFSPGSTPVLGDAYIALRVPGGAKMSLTPTGLVPGLVPFARTVALSAALTQPIATLMVPAGAPPGTYQWLSAITEPGTLNLLTAIDSTVFTVMP